MATTTVEELVKLIAGKFDISDDLLKEVTNKAIGIANKKTEQSLKQRFKEGGVLGLAKDFVFKNKPKEQDNKGILGSLKDLFEKNKPKEQDNKGILGSLKDLFEKNKPKEQDLIKDEEKPQKVLIDGITDNGYKSLASKLPDILKGLFDKNKKENKEEKKDYGGGLLGLLPKGLLGLLKGALMGGGGIALLLGGLAALITGLETEGPWKGTLKILSKVGISGGLDLIKKGATKFIENFKTIGTKIIDFLKKFEHLYKPITDRIGSVFKGFQESGLRIMESAKGKILNFFKPVTEMISKSFKWVSNNILKFVSSIGEHIGDFFKGSTAGKSLGVIGRLASGARGILGHMLGGIVKIIKPIAKRIPIIGTVIGLGFAYTRFKSGDTVGGIIDVLSAFASLVPFAGTAISIGLDVLNAFLDYKAGGADGEASKKKGSMIGDFFGGIWDFIKEKVTGLFSWFTDLGGKLISGKWGDAFEQLAGWIPGLDWVLGFLGTDKDSLIKSANDQGGKNVDMIGNLMNWMKKSIWDKVTGFADNLVGAVKNWWSGVVSWWNGADEGTPPLPQSNQSPKPKEEYVDPNSLGLAEGGIVTKPVKALVGEAGAEAVIPLDQYMSPEGFKISNDLLQTIASNTEGTNKTIENLSQAILKLAVAFNNKQTTPGNNIIVNGQSQPQQYPTAAQVAASNIDPIRQIRMQFAV